MSHLQTATFRPWPPSLPALALICCWSGPWAWADTGQVRIRVIDDASSKPISARLVVRASDGTYPGDRLAVSADRWPNLDAHGVFIPGEASFELPVGKTLLTAAHGLEYRAESRTVEVRSSKQVTVELRLQRVVNMRELGWVAGDLHVHMIHGENQRQTSYEDVALTCEANGLDFVSVGQEYVDAGSVDLAGYHSRCQAVSSDDFVMFLGAERPKSILGHQVLFGCRNPFLIRQEPPYFQSAAAIHAQDGISVYVHPIRYYPGKQYANEWLDFPGNNLARELIFDANLGPTFDGLSVLSDEPAHADAHQLWFNLLNRGCFVPVFADSDACFDRPTLSFKAPGFWNTYFYIGPRAPVTQRAIVNAVRLGRTMATTGPVLQFHVDDQLSGATLPPDGKPREVAIDVHYPQHAFSLLPTDPAGGAPVGISKVDLIRQGTVVKSWEPRAAEVHLRHTIRESQSCWYTVRAYGTDERWQVAVASPIYFADQPASSKRTPRETLIRGRIFDFTSGEEREGTVKLERQGKLLKQFEARGSFETKMPIDAEISVHAAGYRPISKNLLMDYGPIHRFLWYLESRDMGRMETWDRFEFLTREVNLKFAIGQRMAGCYIAEDLDQPTEFEQFRVIAGPPPASTGTVAVAAVVTDVEQIAPGDTMNVAVVYRDEGTAAQCGPYVVEARGYNPERPSGFGALKKFASLERNWQTAQDLQDGYRLITGAIQVPDWVESGPAPWIDLSIRARQGHGDAAFIGLAIPLGTTRRALTVSNSWPTMPLSWPDQSYGIGPLKICNRIGRKSQPSSDYRQLNLSVTTVGKTFDLLPARDGRGCKEADDAMYTEHFLDQILNEESKLERKH